MQPGFHAACLPHHDHATALQLLAERGFTTVAIRSHREFSTARSGPILAEIQQVVQRYSIQLVWDSDGFYLSDPAQLQLPSLDSGNGEVREQQILRSIHWAAASQCALVTFVTGPKVPAVDPELALTRIAESCQRLHHFAVDRSISLAIEARVGSAIASIAHYERLLQWLPGDVRIGLAADTSSMLRQAEVPIVDFLARHKERLRCVYLSEVSRECLAMPNREDEGVDLRRIVQGLDQQAFAASCILIACGGEPLTPAELVALRTKVFG